MAAAAVSDDRRDARFLIKCLDQMWTASPQPNGGLPLPASRKEPLRPQRPRSERDWLARLPNCVRGPLIELHDSEKIQP